MGNTGEDEAGNGTFFAYPGKPELRSEVMRSAAQLISSRLGVATTTWQQLEVEGRLVIGRITSAITAAKTTVAEVGGLNSNVLFEAGYALAQQKNLWLALDDTDTSAVRGWKDLGLLSGIGYTPYGGSSEALYEKFAERRPDLTGAPLWDDLVATAGAPRETRGLFYFPTSLRGDAARALDRMLLARRDLVVHNANEDEHGLAPLAWYVGQIYRSSAALFHLLGPQRSRSQVHNARASLLAGIAHGLELEVLMLAEETFEPPLDYQDLLFRYVTVKSLTDHANHWLDGLPAASGERRRVGRIDLRIELPVQSFGEYVAEYEQEDLQEYFVDTAEFQAVLRGGVSIFTGRKGTGKTANMLIAAQELRSDRRNMVVVIKPAAYELEGLLTVLQRIPNQDLADYFLEALWRFLIYTEVALAAVREAEGRPAGIALGSPMDALRAELEALGITHEQDFTIRLETVVNELLRDLEQLPEGVQEARQFLTARLHANVLVELRKAIGSALSDRQRVALLIDNLDKAWERGTDYERLSRLLLTLLSACGRIGVEFAKEDAWREKVNISLAVFLRADILSVISEYAREPDKISRLQIAWKDPELLARVIEDRYVAARAGEIDRDDLWTTFFCSRVCSMPTRDYLLWRALPRPRDLVFLANAAVTSAANHRRDRVEEDDVVAGEVAYSQFALEALLVETVARFDLEDCLYEFAGLSATVDEEEVVRVLAPCGDGPAAVSWLLRASFFGLEVDEDLFEYPDGEPAEKMSRVLARRLETRIQRPARLRFHPAFRPYLSIKDDDL
jgi:hypothetical protein